MKRFDEWNREKQYVDSITSNLFIKEREIWHTKLGINVGSEENGKSNFLRPVLVIKKIGGLFFTTPLTTKGKDTYFYHNITSVDFGFSSHLILSQGRTVDKKRFIEKIGVISTEEMNYIKKILTEMYLSE